MKIIIIIIITRGELTFKSAGLKCQQEHSQIDVKASVNRCVFSRCWYRQMLCISLRYSAFIILNKLWLVQSAMLFNRGWLWRLPIGVTNQAGTTLYLGPSYIRRPDNTTFFSLKVYLWEQCFVFQFLLRVRASSFSSVFGLTVFQAWCFVSS